MLEVAGSNAAVVAVAYSHNGRILATADGAGAIDLWDPASGYSLIRKITLGSQTTAYSIAFSPDGTTLASGDSDGAIRLWATASGRARGNPIVAMSNKSDPVNSLSFSPDGRTLADAGADGTAKLWNITTRTATTLLNANAAQSQADSVAFSPDGRLVGEGGDDGKLHLWDGRTGKAVALAIGASPGASIVHAVAFSPDGRAFAAGDSDGVIRLRSTTTGDPIGAPIGQQSDFLGLTVSYNTGATLAAISDSDGNVQLLNPASGQLTGARFKTEWGSPLAALSPDGRVLAADSAGDVKIFQAATPSVARTVVKQSDSDFVETPSMAFSPDGRLLATNENHADAQLWNTSTGKLVATFGATKSPVTVLSMAFSPGGATLALGHYDGTVELWDTKTGELSDKYRVGDPINSLAFSPDGKILAVGDNEGIERLYDPTSMRLLTSELPVADDGTFGVGHDQKGIAAVAFSPDGTLLATAEMDGTLRFWNTTSGASVGAVITPAIGSVGFVAFSHDGATLFSGGLDGLIESWPVRLFADPLSALCASVGPPTTADWSDYASGQPFPRSVRQLLLRICISRFMPTVTRHPGADSWRSRTTICSSRTRRRTRNRSCVRSLRPSGSSRSPSGTTSTR